MKKLSYFFILGILLFSFRTHAYSSITVPINEPVYRQLDKLAAFGLIRTMMEGQRPYVRSEIARLIAEAIENYPKFEEAYQKDSSLNTEQSAKKLLAKVHVDQILKQLKYQYREELIQRKIIEGKVPQVQGKALDYIQTDYLYLNEAKEIILPNNGLGGVDAVIQPLVQNREGRQYQSGSNIALETHHWVRFGKYLSFQIQPRLKIQIANSPLQDESQVLIQRLNGRFTWNKLDVEIGRDSIDWGSSSQGGLLFSNNPRPLDFVKISSISPFQYPFFFKKLGFHEMSLVIANLGKNQIFQYPSLVAYKISSRSNPYFEFGFTQSLELGGEGAPKVGLGEGILQFFDITRNDVVSNRNVDIELIGRIPKFRGLKIYADINFADFTSNWNTMFVDNTSYLAGVYLPRLNNTGTLDARLEYRRLAPRYARSPVFTDGMTEDQLLLGDPIGPDSQSVLLEFFYELNTDNLLSFSFEFLQRNNDIYQKNGSMVTKLVDLGDETRFLYQLGWRHQFNPYLVGRLGLGLEQVQGAIFTSNPDTFNWRGEGGLTVYLSPQQGN